MTTKANIIIIEDEKNICSFIEHILEPQGYRVISANTGKEGLQYITSEHPDVILLDLGLPDIALPGRGDSRSGSAGYGRLKAH